MNEITTFCPNCMMPLFFVLPADEVKIICPECGLRIYGSNKVLKWENRASRWLSRGIAPKRLSGKTNKEEARRKNEGLDSYRIQRL
jgi:uncharacterized Zn finger protein (UPF0148 family)